MRLPLHPLLTHPNRTAKGINRVELLNLIRERGPVSRADLARVSRLSKPTVSEQVAGLIREGWAVETGRGESGSQGGKKPTLVRFNSDGGRVIGVEIGPEQIRASSADLDGVIRATTVIDTEAAQGAGRVLSRVRQAIGQLLKWESGCREKLKAISVASPGRVDVDRGVVLELGNLFGWKNVPVAGKLRESFGVPVFVDNDVNMAALGEARYGIAGAVPNFVLVRLGIGIGAGIVAGGELHRGTHWAAGEIGHMVLGAVEQAGEYHPRGHLESVVGADRVGERVRAAAKHSKLLSRLLQSETEQDALFKAARQGDGAALKITAEVGAHLGAAVAHLAAAYDPELVVLLGPALEFYTDEVRGVVERALQWPIRVCTSEAGEEAAIFGAIVAGLRVAYEEISVSAAGREAPVAARANA